MSNCSKCQSEKVIPDVRIRDGGSLLLSVDVYDHPEALVFKGAHSRTLQSQVCGDCGHVESYVENPQELYEIYLASQQPK